MEYQSIVVSIASGALTRNLLALVSSNSAHDGVILALDTVRNTLCVAFGLSGFDFCLSFRVLFLSRCLPRLGAGSIADGFDNVALD